jgi:hypothetical protein
MPCGIRVDAVTDRLVRTFQQPSAEGDDFPLCVVEVGNEQVQMHLLRDRPVTPGCRPLRDGCLEGQPLAWPFQSDPRGLVLDAHKPTYSLVERGQAARVGTVDNEAVQRPNHA